MLHFYTVLFSLLYRVQKLTSQDSINLISYLVFTISYGLATDNRWAIRQTRV